MKRFIAFCIILAAVVGACRPQAPAEYVTPASSSRPVFGSVPPPAGTGIPFVVAGKQQPNAIAPGTSGNVLTSNGSAWVSQAAGGGGGAVNLWSPAAIGATAAANWSVGDKTAGRIIAVNNQAVVVTGVKVWTSWGGGARTIKATVCTCTNMTCTAATNTASQTASISGSGAVSTITFGSPPTLAASTLPYLVAVYDTSATSYPYIACPANLGQGGACGTPSAFGVYSTPMIPFHADGAGHEVWMGWGYYTAGDACPTTAQNTGQPLANEFYVVEPVIQ